MNYKRNKIISFSVAIIGLALMLLDMFSETGNSVYTLIGSILITLNALSLLFYRKLYGPTKSDLENRI